MGLHVGDQCISGGLARWVPLFAGGVWNFTPYSTRARPLGGFTFGCHIDHRDFPDDDASVRVTPNDVMSKGKTLLDDDFPLEAARSAIAECKGLRQYLLGDFHLLLPLTISSHDWCAWQFHCPVTGAGSATFFRRHRSPFPTMQVRLRGVATDGVYDVTLSPEYAEAPPARMKGRDLASLSVTIPQCPGSLLLRYRPVSSP
jgi:hypothetical protein